MHSLDGSALLHQPAQPSDQAAQIVRTISKPEIEPAAAPASDSAHVHAADGARFACCTPLAVLVTTEPLRLRPQATHDLPLQPLQVAHVTTDTRLLRASHDS